MFTTDNAKVVSLLVLFSLILGLFFIKPINLTSSDLGRHIKNGELVVTTKKFVTTNLYSYTFPDYPFINHHWGFGVLTYIGYKTVGFDGLTLLNALLATITIFMILKHLQSQVGIKYLLFALVLLAPILTYRTEVRPESLSTLLMIVLTVVLLSDLKLSLKMIVVTLLQLMWVNIHIFFAFGLVITACYTIVNKKALLILLPQILACLINPLGIIGALYPLQIFNSYGYRILENQTPFLLIKVAPSPIYYYLIGSAVVFVALILSTVFWWLKNPRVVFYVVLSLIFMVLSLKMVRAMPYFGLFGIASLAYLLQFGFEKYKTRLNCIYWHPQIQIVSGGVGFCLIVVLFTTGLFNPIGNFYIGVPQSMNKSAQFFKTNHLKGPIFNNYDIGGYLIFHLYPQNRVFVDNRPEAYPVSLFTNEYVAMQENEEVWAKLSQKYGFNAIYFNRLDYTPWAQPFLIRRIEDPAWAPVYVDESTIILVKRVDQNMEVFDKYELPESTFMISR